MKFKADTKAFQKALSVVSRAIPRKADIPVMGCVKIEATESMITLTGFNGAMAITATIDAAVTTEGATLAPAGFLGGMVNSLPSGEATFTLKDNFLKAGKGSKIACLYAEDYPSIPDVIGECMAIEAEALSAALSRVMPSVSTDLTKQILCGVRFGNKDGKLELASTDGHRLAIAPVDAEGVASEFVIPREPLEVLQRQLADGLVSICLANDGRLVSIATEGVIIISKTLEGTYPNVWQLVKEGGSPTSFSRVGATDELKRCQWLADAAHNLVSLSITADKIGITIDGKDIGAAEASVPAESATNLDIYFNIQYLLEGIGSFKAEILTMETMGPTAPAVISADKVNEGIYLLMPIQKRNVG